MQELDAEAIPRGAYQIGVDFTTAATGQFVFILKVTKKPTIGRSITGRTLVPVVKLG